MGTEASGHFRTERPLAFAPLHSTTVGTPRSMRRDADYSYDKQWDEINPGLAKRSCLLLSGAP